MMLFSQKHLLTIEQIDFPLHGVQVLRQPDVRAAYRPVSGPYYADELLLLRAALDKHRGRLRGLALREERGGLTICCRR